jgi:hypothetical protein
LRSSTLLLSSVVVLGVTLALALLSGIVRPTMFSDSGWGFVDWDASAGLPFNHVAFVDPADIARDGIGFPTWWTPGQYLLPGLLEMASLDLGIAMTIVSTLFSLLGLAGWFVLYRSLGFPAATSAITVAIVACTRHFALPFGSYNGGEVLLFGVAPWFLVLVWRLRTFHWTAIVPLLAGSAVVVFAKLSGLILAGAAMGAAVAASPGPWFTAARIRRGLVAALTLGLMGVIFYVGWFSRGATPVSNQGGVAWLPLVNYAVFVIGAAWGAALSLGELASYALLNPNRGALSSVTPIYWAFLAPAVATCVFVAWRLRAQHAEYLRFVLFLGLAVGFVLMVVSARGASVGADERHMRIVSLVLFVGIVHAALEPGSRWIRALFVGVVVLAGSYGIASAVAHAAANLQRPLGSRGFRHTIATAPALDFIHKIDAAASVRRSVLLVVTSPEIALEGRNVRVMSNHVIVQQRLVDNGKATIILRSFVDYPSDRWRKIPLGDFVAFAAEG